MENMPAFPMLTDIVTRILLSAILLAAGYAKISDPAYTEQVLKNLGFLSKQSIPLIKRLLPIVEIIIGVVLFIPFITAYIAAITGALFATFMVALSIPLLQGRGVVCGCFGKAGREKITKLTILRTGLLFLATTLNSLGHFGLVTSWIFSGGFLFAIAGCCLVWWTTPNTTFFQTHALSNKSATQQVQKPLTRRAALKMLALVLAAILQPVKSASALQCCACEYQLHYDQHLSNCCGSFNAYHLHHYWKRCKNTCTGQRGNWHKLQPDSCQCECLTCSDITWTQNECCYATECCCNMGICECGCPC